MTPIPSSPTVPTPSTTAPVPRPTLLAALATTALTAGLGPAAPWLPQLDEALAQTLLGLLLGTRPAALLLAAVALCGLAAGITALAGALPRPALLLVAALQVLVVGVGLGSMTILSMAGYLLALAMPFIVGLLLVQSIRRFPRARPALLAATVLAVAAGTVLLGETVFELGGYLLPAFVAALPLTGFTLLLVVVGAAWAAVGVLALRGSDRVGRLTVWITRHRVLFTVLAACGPLPYALLRLTWLTPWPMLSPIQDIELSTRLWGLTLSSGAWLAVVLTLGLIRPWGEVFPRWMPVVAGRPVPIVAAAVPGGAVAALLSFAAIPLLVGAARQGEGPSLVLELALIFPCWLWGPTLALAVWGYVGHRRDQQLRATSPEISGARPA